MLFVVWCGFWVFGLVFCCLTWCFLAGFAMLLFGLHSMRFACGLYATGFGSILVFW